MNVKAEFKNAMTHLYPTGETIPNTMIRDMLRVFTMGIMVGWQDGDRGRTGHPPPALMQLAKLLKTDDWTPDDTWRW